MGETILVLNISVSTLLIITYLWMVIIAARYIIDGGNGSSPYLLLVGAAMILVQLVDVGHAGYEFMNDALVHQNWWVYSALAKLILLIFNVVYYMAVLIESKRSFKRNTVIRNLIFGRIIDDNN